MGIGLVGIDTHTHTQKTIYEKFSTFSPVYSPTKGYQLDYTYAPTLAYDSPGTVGAVVTTKKQMTQTPDITGATTSQSPTAQLASGGDMMGTILLLGALGIGAYVLLGVMKKKKSIKK